MDKQSLTSSERIINNLFVGKLMDGTIILCDIAPGIALKRNMKIVDPKVLSNMSISEIEHSVGCSSGKINTDECAFSFVKKYEYKTIWDICSIVEKITDIDSVSAKKIVLYYHIRNVCGELKSDRSSLSSLFQIRF